MNVAWSAEKYNSNIMFISVDKYRFMTLRWISYQTSWIKFCTITIFHHKNMSWIRQCFALFPSLACAVCLCLEECDMQLRKRRVLVEWAEPFSASVSRGTQGQQIRMRAPWETIQPHVGSRSWSFPIRGRGLLE